MVMVKIKLILSVSQGLNRVSLIFISEKRVVPCFRPGLTDTEPNLNRKRKSDVSAF
ncbi:hypothetical protein XBI1_860002 [Xenorhabdus bovienii str. Intermedium]|uniref:Uncharacterized protein n=1 Tax=Xenorhabdus bovienii str. Intermedium TaxID=1379677 RepID=A0A077QRM3_XENBV|nr:hypothetical protein XBI1_860002 [Xenorhabdus bovienii str. Intermedium]